MFPYTMLLYLESEAHLRAALQTTGKRLHLRRVQPSLRPSSVFIRFPTMQAIGQAAICPRRATTLPTVNLPR